MIAALPPNTHQIGSPFSGTTSTADRSVLSAVKPMSSDTVLPIVSRILSSPAHPIERIF